MLFIAIRVPPSLLTDMIVHSGSKEAVQIFLADAAKAEAKNKTGWSNDQSGNVKHIDQCTELALQLRDRAEAVDKYLSLTVIAPDEYYKWYGKQLSINSYHTIIMVRIGNELWFVEPSNDKVWLAYNMG